MAPKQPTRLARLLSKIHPPLPLLPRESQQLTKALAQSFQDHLDREHPQPSSTVRTPSEAHLSSILANPHFDTSRRSVVRRRSRSRTSLPATAGSTIEQLQTFLLDQPRAQQCLDTFRDEIVAGEATLESAKVCLRACVRDHLFPNVSKELPAVPSQQLPGHVVVNWLWSTGLEESMEFVYDTEFTHLLIPHLVREGHSKRVVRWVERINATLAEQLSTLDKDTELASAGAALFTHLIEATTRQHGVNESLNIFNGHTAVITSSEVARHSHKRAARLLCQSLISSKFSGTNVAAYDQFSRSLPRLLRGRQLQYNRAWLSLKHPQSPNPDLAMVFLRQAKISSEKRSNKSLREAAVRNYLEVVSVLTSQGRDQEAEEMLRLLEQTFPVDGNTNPPANPIPQHSSQTTITLPGLPASRLAIE